MLRFLKRMGLMVSLVWMMLISVAFANVPTILLTHCESTPRIKQREAFYRNRYGEEALAYSVGTDEEAQKP